MNSKIKLAITLGAMLTTTASAAFAGPSSDEIRRLKMQHYLDYDVPFIESTWIGTHNSYNNSDDGYVIPNHHRDMIDQLDAGFRVLSWDIRYTWFEFRLCHNNGFGVCGATDTRVKDALKDLKSWLAANPDEVVMIVVEDYMASNTERNDLGFIVKDKIKDYLYSPKDRYDNDNGGCKSIPASSLTKADMLAAGKQLIITTATGNCNHGGGQWRKRVFNLKNKAYTGSYSSNSLESSKMVIVAEDRVFGSSSDHLSGSEIETALEHSANIIGLDFGITTDRHDKEIWSWGPNQPDNADNSDCAIMNSQGEWQDERCDQRRRFACQNPLDGAWAISTGYGAYNNGPGACAQLGGYVFAAPVNAYMNKKLYQAMVQAGPSSVWIAASDRLQEGWWVVENVIDRTEY